MPIKSGSKTSKLRRLERRAAQTAHSSTVSSPSESVSSRRAAELSISGHGPILSSSRLRPQLEIDTSQTTLKPIHLHQTSDTSITSPPSEGSPQQASNSNEKAKELVPSQTTLLVNEFEAALPRLVNLVLHAKIRTQGLEDLCACGRGKRVVTCYECHQAQLTCVTCFEEAHRLAPLHWADLWVPEQRCFVRHDPASLLPSFSIHLGHSGHRCPFTSASDTIDLVIIETNGVHRTRVTFCACQGIPDRVDQLVAAGLFPATLKKPRTAFTFSVLSLFHLLQLESKTSAYDFCNTIRRLTDNEFTEDVTVSPISLTSLTFNPTRLTQVFYQDIYPQFIVVMQIWRVLKASLRSGQAHHIDKVLTHRTPRNLIVHCPVCPEPHFNVDDGWQDIPDCLRHLNQLQLTADGNHHANRYMKNTDPLSRSLFDGCAYFPTATNYKEYLSSLTSDHAEKTTCNHLNAAEKQDRKKFKNMDITGIVNIQCSHVFVKSSVDLQLGERFANTDMALFRALSLYQVLDVEDPAMKHITSRDIVLSYDIACGYFRHLLDRFGNNFSTAVKVVEQTRPMIPAVHVLNHQDSCLYLYGSAYLPNVGHFHGETAEQYWVELNQLGPQIRQMNNGHRQDCIIDSHSDWNWKKTVHIHVLLAMELKHARDTYLHHKLRFQALCQLHKDHIGEWDKLDREKREMEGKEVICVYSFSKRKIPTQQTVLASLLSERSKDGSSSPSVIAQNDVVGFVDEGISIQTAQYELKTKLAAYNRHPLELLKKENEEMSKNIRKRLDEWRTNQKLLTPQLSDWVQKQVSQSLSVEDERLFLPSDFGSAVRKRLKLDSLAIFESRLREGVAFDTIMALQQHAKTLDILLAHKRKDCRGQDQHTRASASIMRVTAQRQALIDRYNGNRTAMISLGLNQPSRSFPAMDVKDTLRQSPFVKRQLGASRPAASGLLWTLPTSHVPPSLPLATSNPATSSDAPKATFTNPIATQGSAKAFKRSKSITVKVDITEDTGKEISSGEGSLNKPPNTIGIEDGWIWKLGKIGDLSEDDVRNWEQEGDRVHWFRAEAEMERWREQWEIKIVEFIRCIRSFRQMARTWETLGKTKILDAHSIYASRKSAVFTQLAEQANHTFASSQAVEPVRYVAGEDIVDYIARHRSSELRDFHSSYTPRLLKMLPVKTVLD